MAQTLRIRVADGDLQRINRVASRLNLNGPVAVFERAVELLETVATGSFEAALITRDGCAYGLRIRGWSKLKDRGFSDPAQVVAQAVAVLDSIGDKLHEGRTEMRSIAQSREAALQQINEFSENISQIRETVLQQTKEFEEDFAQRLHAADEQIKMLRKDIAQMRQVTQEQMKKFEGDIAQVREAALELIEAIAADIARTRQAADEFIKELRGPDAVPALAETPALTSAGKENR